MQEPAYLSLAHAREAQAKFRVRRCMELDKVSYQRIPKLLSLLGVVKQ
jgi:hypothetical protein